MMRVFYKFDKSSLIWASIALVSGRSFLVPKKLEIVDRGHSLRGNEFYWDQLLIDNKYLAVAVCVIGLILVFVRVDFQRENQG